VGKHVSIQILDNWLIQWWTLPICRYCIGGQKTNEKFRNTMWILHNQPKKLMKNLGMQCEYCGVKTLENII